MLTERRFAGYLALANNTLPSLFVAPDETPDLESIQRREAHSGRLSYGGPILLHESSRMRVQGVPYFIPRSAGGELALKIVTYAKQAPPNDWAVVETKAVTLNEASLRILSGALRTHFAVAGEEADGEYIVIRADRGTADFSGLDPVVVTAALGRVLSRPDIARHLATAELSDELIVAFRGAIRLREMRSAVATLREHLESGVVTEAIYQAWCKRHSWAFGNAYVLSDDVRSISAGDQIDLLLPSVITGFRDVVELKRPDFPVLMYDASHRNYYFGVETSKAIGQVHRYLDVLHDAAANGLRDHSDIVAYHPRAIIVIGRSHAWEAEQRRALQGLNSRLNGVTVMTYDQLLAQGERLIDVLSVEQGELFDADPAPSGDDEWENLPF